MTRVLIVGGAGFIGAHLAQRCLDRGDEVHVIARSRTDLWRLAGMRSQLTVHVLELGDRSALDRCFVAAGPEEVYHLATQTRWEPAADLSDAARSASTDLLNMIHLLAAASAADPAPRALVRAGSLTEYGDGPVPFEETQRESPVNAYGAAMTACTHYAQMLAPRLPFPALTARLALAYGPDQDADFLIPTLFRNCAAGEPMRLNRPEDRRDLIHVRDVTDALCRLASSGLPAGTLVNVVTGSAPTMREVAALVARTVGVDPASIQEGSPAGTEAADASARVHGSPALARELLGWEARTSLTEGLRLLWDSLRSPREAGA